MSLGGICRVITTHLPTVVRILQGMFFALFFSAAFEYCHLQVTVGRSAGQVASIGCEAVAAYGIKRCRQKIAHELWFALVSDCLVYWQQEIIGLQIPKIKWHKEDRDACCTLASMIEAPVILKLP